MKIQALAVPALAAVAIAAAGCGDDEPSSSGSATQTTPSSASTATLRDIEPRKSKPNLAQGDAPIEELLELVTGDAKTYWAQVFQNSELSYREPRVNIVSEPTDAGCDTQFDPAERVVFTCINRSGGPSLLTYSALRAEAIRGEIGDGAIAFLGGFAPALDAVAQLPQFAAGPVDAQQADLAVCFNGAWIRNLGDREILEAGDDQEVLDAAAAAAGEGKAQLNAELVNRGYSGGIAACEAGGEATP